MSLQILKMAHENLQRLRRTGSTTIKKLYGDLPAFVLVAHNDIYAHQIKREMCGYKGRMTLLSMSAGQEANLRGIHDPIAVDNGALLHVIDLGINGMEERDRTISHLKKVVELHDSVIRRLGQALLKIWPRHYDEKRWNKNGGWDYDHIDEANRIVDMATRAIGHNARIFRQYKSIRTAVKYGRIKTYNSKRKLQWA